MQLAFYVFYCVADKPWPNKLDGKQLSLSTAQQEGSTVNIKRALLAKSCLYEAQQCTSIDNASTRTCSAHQSCATIKQNAVQLHWWRTMHCRVFKANTLFLLSTKQAGAKTTPRSAPRNKNEKPCGAPFGLFSHWLLQFIATEQWIKLTKMNKHEMGWQHVPFMLESSFLYGHLKPNWAHAFILQTTYIQALYIIVTDWILRGHTYRYNQCLW